MIHKVEKNLPKARQRHPQRQHSKTYFFFRDFHIDEAVKGPCWALWPDVTPEQREYFYQIDQIIDSGWVNNHRVVVVGKNWVVSQNDYFLHLKLLSFAIDKIWCDPSIIFRRTRQSTTMAGFRRNLVYFAGNQQRLVSGGSLAVHHLWTTPICYWLLCSLTHNLSQ